MKTRLSLFLQFEPGIDVGTEETSTFLLKALHLVDGLDDVAPLSSFFQFRHSPRSCQSTTGLGVNIDAVVPLKGEIDLLLRKTTA